MGYQVIKPYHPDITTNLTLTLSVALVFWSVCRQPEAVDATLGGLHSALAAGSGEGTSSLLGRPDG